MTSDPVGPSRLAGKGGRNVLASFVGPQIRRLHYSFIGHWQGHFEELGLSISPVQGGILLLIDQWEAITQKKLSDIMEVEQASMHETLRPLLKGGLLERTVNPEDRRSFVLFLTGAGKEAVCTIHDNIAAHERAVLTGLTPDEIQTLKALLKKALPDKGQSVPAASAAHRGRGR